MVRRTPSEATEDIVDKSDTRPDNLYPEWSWEHVRTYVAVRRGDEYSDEQIEILAKQDIVMLEKMNGHETHGSVEKGALAAAKRIKAVNPKVKILFYLNTMLHYGGKKLIPHKLDVFFERTLIHKPTVLSSRV
jgi:hypothetical protein